MFMKTRSCIRWALALPLIVAIGCQDEPLQLQDGADCGGCEDIPPGGGTLAQMPSINSFSPASGYAPFNNTGIPGTRVTLNGSDFSTTISGNSVRFASGVTAPVHIATAAQVVTSVPPMAVTGRISVTVNNATGQSLTDFIVLPQNVWQTLGDFGGVARASAVSFVIKNMAYVGTGFLYQPKNPGLNPSRDFWRYNPKTDTWTQMADFGGPARGAATGFATGSRGYIGTGTNGTAPGMRDFWEYHPGNNTWTQKASLPGLPRVYSAGFAISAKGYIGTGLNSSSGYLKDFWEYDPSTDQWTQKEDFGGAARAYAGSFVINGKGYLGIGQHQITPAPDLWEYDPVVDSWTAKANVGSNFAGGHSAFFSIGSKGYVGGHNNQLWMFDPIADSWVQKANFPGNANMTAGVSFSVEGFGYIGLGSHPSGSTNLTTFYRYTPD
jgi:N-acetylneuraminic acid mutarotase